MAYKGHVVLFSPDFPKPLMKFFTSLSCSAAGIIKLISLNRQVCLLTFHCFPFVYLDILQKKKLLKFHKFCIYQYPTFPLP